ncbi:Glutathione-regulated potassium-efflux system ancillary protein KefF [Rosistilla carotiformis]|uniref:Glutathione-regulated potassium-efflux system ancillary protein KefF n=2 Tax=Rosistilla carotiformis TaxID=2528017 RepID=A0A518JV32_9BACT|nr:Glutathione-regulated potassium-efflux system ancillary protein KefF [Rosistilla carotiformis]
MKVLIVHAHHEPQSFSSSLAKRAEEKLLSLGHEVTFSDLYALKFDPVSDRRNFTTTKDSGYLKQQAEEVHATENDGFAPDVEAEMQKLETADAVIFSFPLWWFGMPAILKGWADRVLAAGRIYGGPKLFEGGIGGGIKRGLVLMTTGGGEATYGGWGVNPALDRILAPIQHGIFWFNGFRPLDPFVAWSPAHIGDAGRREQLQELDRRMESLFDEALLTLPPLADFPGSSVDTKNRFQVVVRFVKPFDEEFHRLVPAEHQMIDVWRRDGRLLEFARSEMDDPNPRVFMTLRATDAAEVQDWFGQLPLADYLEAEVTKLHKPV